MDEKEVLKSEDEVFSVQKNTGLLLRFVIKS